MTYQIGQSLKWIPIYFRWDVTALVTVVKLYRCGSALLSNHQTVDDEGNAVWENGRIVGKVETL